MKLQILMSTYNGEKHIREQLESLLEQTVWKKKEWQIEIVIRDDGSVDDTCKILMEYEQACEYIHVYKEKNVGVIASFFDLIRKVEKDVDYIALSDQDDVWMPDKLECAVNSLNKENAEMPLLYCGKPMLTDEMLNPIPSIMYGENVRPSFGNALIENICTGCTAVFNYKLAELVQFGNPEFTVMHDWWLYLLASCFGKVIIDVQPHIFYRQHGENTVGVQKNYWNECKARMHRFHSNRYNIHKQVISLKKICNMLACEMSLIMPEDKQKLLEQILMARDHVGIRVKLVRNPCVYRQRKGDNIIFSLILLTGTM